MNPGDIFLTILESEEYDSFVESNRDAIIEATTNLYGFSDVVKQYVVENIADFIGDGSIESFYENVRMFTESAISSYCHELTA